MRFRQPDYDRQVGSRGEIFPGFVPRKVFIDGLSMLLGRGSRRRPRGPRRDGPSGGNWRQLLIFAVILFLLALLLLLWIASARGAAQDPEPLAGELPRIRPLEPGEALQAFRIDGSYRIELAASEPLVVDPVAMEFDESGRMFVLEMRDYPFTGDPGNMTASEEAGKQPSGRVRLLEDTDGDGRADRSAVFADGLHWPTGIALWRSGVIVAAAPDILFLEDLDGDGIADARRVLWTGFGRRNVQALLNSLRWGIDGRLHGASGGNGGAIVPGDRRQAAAVAIGGRDFCFSPEGGPLETEPGGGQFGLSFDAWGRRFICNNSNHLRHVVVDGGALDRNPYLPARPAVADIAADGGAAPVFRMSPPEPWRVVRTRWRASSPEASRYPPTELHVTGYFTSATGIHIYCGDALPEDLSGNAFIGDVGGNLVHRKVLHPRGPTFAAARAPEEREREFLTSTDNWFRPVAFAEGPDGCLYVLDMYRETIEHPYSIPESIKRHLSLTSGNDRGRIWRIAPRDFRPGPRPSLGKAAAGELIGFLGHPNAWHRLTAERLIIERRDPESAALLREALERSGEGAPPPIARAHGLWILERLGKLRPEEIARALADPHPRVREQAVRLAGRRLAGEPGLLEPLCRLAGDADARVRLEAAVALGESAAPQAREALGRIARRDGGDPWFQAAILSSAGRDPAALLAALVPAPAAGEVGSGGDRRIARALAGPLAEAAGAMDRPEAIARTLAAIAPAASGGEDDLASAALAGLGAGLRRAGRSLPALLQRPPAELSSAVAKIHPLFESAAGRAVDRGLAPDRRLGAARLLAHAPLADAGETLAKLLSAREPQALQVEAAQALSARPEAGIAGLLIGRWARCSPPVRGEILEALLRRPERTGPLLEAIAADAISRREIDPDSARRLREHPDPALRARARALLDTEAASSRKEVIDRFHGALHLRGVSARGLETYRARCATCHRLGDEGRAVGPDLATIRDREPEALLIQILDPNREVLPQYISYLIVTRDGQTLTGIIASETGTSITLRRAEGAEDSVLRSQIRELRASGLSLMPEDLERDLSAQDLADLLACLRGG